MNKTAFLFTGQGGQYAGMGKDLYENYAIFKQVFDQASDYLNIDLLEICSTSESLSTTKNAQCAIFCMSYGLFKIITQEKQEKNIIPDFIAGFSLGEITSLAVANMLTFEQTLDLIGERGRVMDEACANKPGAMYSIIGAVDAFANFDELVEQTCEDLRKSGNYVIPANYNCPGQLVISGEISACEKAAKIFSDLQKNIRIVKLNLAGAFHSELMLHKSAELQKFIKQNLSFKLPNVNLFSNLTGDLFDFNNINLSLDLFMQDYLIKQMSSPVKFRLELENLAKLNCDKFIEIGAGKALSGFVRRTCAGAKFANIQDCTTLNNLNAL